MKSAKVQKHIKAIVCANMVRVGVCVGCVNTVQVGVCVGCVNTVWVGSSVASSEHTAPALAPDESFSTRGSVITCVCVWEAPRGSLVEGAEP